MWFSRKNSTRTVVSYHSQGAFPSCLRLDFDPESRGILSELDLDPESRGILSELDRNLHSRGYF